MIELPLSRHNRQRLARAFTNVTDVDISVQSVLEDQMGTAYTDSIENPERFMIEQDGFFSYFAGDFSTESGQAFLADVPGGRLLMAGSPGWQDALKIYGDRLKAITRYSFSSDSLTLNHLKSLATSNPDTASIQKMTLELAESGYPYFEIGAFDSTEDFIQRGTGYCMIAEDKIVAVAYSSLACNSAIEISIFVDDAYRRKGVATTLSAQLLIECLEQGITPHWDAANKESCALAEKLGYTFQSEYTAYFLKPAQ